MTKFVWGKFQRSLLQIDEETIKEQILNVDPTLPKNFPKPDGFFGELTRLLNVSNSYNNRQHLHRFWKVTYSNNQCGNIFLSFEFLMYCHGGTETAKEKGTGETSEHGFC